MERIMETNNWQEKHYFVYLRVNNLSSFAWDKFCLGAFEDCQDKICKITTNLPHLLGVGDDRKFA